MLSRLKISARDLLRSALAPSQLDVLWRLDEIRTTQTRWPTDDPLLAHLWSATGRYSDPRSLSRFEARVYSQNGEDGILAKILRRVGTSKGYFIEIGAGDGRENITRLLLEAGWEGVWVEGGGENVGVARSVFRDFLETGSLKIIHSFVDISNVNHLLDEAGVPAHVDVLSVDTDMNTSHLWRAISRSSSVACIEYNATLPASASLEALYMPDGQWDSASSYYGASLRALCEIAQDKKSSLVGCDPTGVNAFFVANDELGDHFLAPHTAEAHYEPPRLRRVGSRDGYPGRQDAQRWKSGSDPG